MNKLTERLLTEGYTKENHPEFVEWTDWLHFEYTNEYLAKSVWETPCGLLKKGTGYNHGSHMGVTYCPENDNPRFGCPYYDEKPCSHRFDTNKLWGWNCVYHQTDRPYDYEQSTEKIWDGWDEIQAQAFQKIGVHCRCMEWSRPKRKYVPRFNVDNCIGCANEACIITKNPRNLEKVNIFYDVLREKHYRIGLVEDTERTLEKGVKVFGSPIARTDAELWLMAHGNDDIFRPKRADRSDLHFSEYHGKTGFGEYDFFEFTVTIQNVRIERRETRNLLQDLADVREGIKVIHAGDIIKAAAKTKRENREKYRDAKANRLEKKNIAKWRQLLTDEEAAKTYAEEKGIGFDWLIKNAARELARRGIVIDKKKEQLNLFG